MAVLCACYLAVCLFDYSQKRIPNWLMLLVTANGLCYRFAEDGIKGIFLYLGQAIGVFILFFLFFRIGGLGAGDVKLLASTSGYLLFERVLLFLFISLLISALLSLILLIHRKQLTSCIRRLSEYINNCILNGEFRRIPSGKEAEMLTVCMSGPVFVSLLLHIGGAY